MTWTVLVLLWVVCAGFSALIANSKGRSVGGFAVAGLLLGVIGLLWAAFAKSQAQIDAAREYAAGARERQWRAEDRAMVRRQRWPD